MHSNQPISYSETGAFSKLFEAYVSQDEDVLSYFDGAFSSPEVLQEKIASVTSQPRDRETLVQVLLAQNERWGMDETTRQNIEKLRQPNALAVVTGQQVGLLAGALYTPLKTITAIQLAKKIEAETGHPTVPVFWLEGEDHDFAEVSVVNFMQGNKVVPISYAGHQPPSDGNLGPVGNVVFSEQIIQVLEQVETLLPPTDFQPVLLEKLREIYTPGTTFRDTFAKLMRFFFPKEGLVFISPADSTLKEMVKPLFQKELKEFQTTEGLIQKVSESLQKDYHAQVHGRATNLFKIESEGRFSLEPAPKGFHLRGTEKTYPTEEIYQQLEESPDTFSPNVVMRPLMQDWLLPTIAYIAGPGEIAYFAQYKPLYRWAGLPMPIIYPRASATLIESKVVRVLERHELNVSDFAQDFEQLFKSVVLKEASTDVEAVFKTSLQPIHVALNEIKKLAGEVDKSLEGATEALRASLMKELNKFKGRIIQAEKRHHDQTRQQLEKAKAGLFPNGLQERSVSILYFMNKYGLDFPAKLAEQLSLDTTKHQLITL